MLLSSLAELAGQTVAGLVGGTVAVGLSSWLTQRRERDHLAFKAVFDGFLSLEATAGFVVEHVTGDHGDYRKGEIFEALRDLTAKQGSFRRYPAVNEAIRELTYAASILHSRREKSDSKDEVDSLRAKLIAAFDILIRECDAITRRRV